MTSQINPNNVNTAYPVAGQDNSTQGFRDNFTNIKLNFTYAASEISALQNSVVYTGNVNDLGGGTLYDTTLQNIKYATVTLGAAAPVANINYASGSFQSLIANANTTLNITNLPATGNTATLTLSVAAQAANTTATPYTLTIPNVSSSTSGIVGLSGNVLTFPQNNSTTAGTHVYQLTTSDQGASFVITPLQTTAQPFNSLSEDVANAAVINLGKSDSYFGTSAAEVATLPAGVNGQVKVLAMYADAGDMVITVTNAGWKTSGPGTITFDTIGDACTLKYINSKWFCIGNNGCTFA